MLDRRSLYIKEQTSYKGKGRRVKIGITGAMKSRHAAINEGLPGNWGNVTDKRLFFARKTEAFFHRKYRAFHTPLKNLKPGSGGSEIFTISSHQLAILRLTLGAIAAADLFIFVSAVAIGANIIFLLCYFLF